MKTIFVSILLVVVAFLFSACGGEPRTANIIRLGDKNPAPSQEQGTNPSPTPENPTDKTVQGAGSGSLFQLPQEGVLVIAPADTKVRPWQKPQWSEQSIASALFQRPGGKQYTLLVYKKGKEQSFQDWLKQSEVGDAAASPVTVKTRNDFTGYVYETNDLGSLPDIHITIPTQEYVYYFHWDTGLPEDPEQAARIMKEQNLTFQVPEDFLNFAREIGVK